MSPVDKPDLSKWQNRAKQVAKYHSSCCEENSKWRIEDTATELQRSKGRVSEDLMLAEEMSKDAQVEKFKTAQEALDYVRRKKRDEKLNRFNHLNHSHKGKKNDSIR